ncbi:MAG: hypothetical protein AB7E05_14185 [Sphingobium sp.]
MNELTTTAAFLIPTIVTVLGWFVVSGMTGRREFRKEVREHIKDMRARCDTVRASAKEYWLEASAQTSAAAATSLKSDLARLSRQLQVLQFVGLEIDGRLMAEIRMSATGDDFEKKGRRRKASDYDRLLDINGAIDDLQSSVDELFYQRFRPSKANRLIYFLPLGLSTALDSDAA